MYPSVTLTRRRDEDEEEGREEDEEKCRGERRSFLRGMNSRRGAVTGKTAFVSLTRWVSERHRDRSESMG